MKPFWDLVNRGKRLTDGMLFMIVFKNKEIQNMVIKLNHDQLRSSQLSDDTLIPFVYSEKSIEEFGKRPGRWTLFDTGELYDSFRVIQVTPDYLVEYGDLEKEGRDFDELFNGNVLGLNSESVEIIKEEILPIIRQAVLDTLVGERSSVLVNS